MKKIITSFIVLFATATFLTSCLEDVFPTQYATGDQIGRSPVALQALSNSTAALMVAHHYFGTLTAQEIGFPGMMMIRDALTDVPVTSTRFNHFNTPWGSLSDFTSNRVQQPWRFYYLMVLNANLTIRAVGYADDAPAEIRGFAGNALVYRAMSYLDLMRMYEFQRTGVPALDAYADQQGIWGLTVPIVDEHFDDRYATNNPRQPFYVMYRFILSDLNRAERYLEGLGRSSLIRADVSVVHAFKARLWLEIATRFQRYPADLATQLANEDNSEIRFDRLGINTARDAFVNAAHYARLVINDGRYSPLTYEQWHCTTNGFNNMNTQQSWIFAASLRGMENVTRLDSFAGHAITEYSRGYSRSQYYCYRMMDRVLFSQIQLNDWRRATWKAPESFHGRPAVGAAVPPIPPQYHTLFRGVTEQIVMGVGDWEWHHRDAFTGFKFRPGSGHWGEDWQLAGQMDFPIIRVEEMYFIEAEAITVKDGLSAGVAALSSFLNTHRFRPGTQFEAHPESIDNFIDDYLIAQKRIEFWGEGLAFFDIKRRRIALTRGYPGSNWIETNRFNSLPGYTASWLNFFIPENRESAQNHAIRTNPNPNVMVSYGLWRE
jgi:hypothetical protein